MSKLDLELMEELFERIKSAEEKHPIFADGVYQGFGRITEELGEAAQAVNHGESEERIHDEVMDLLCVVWRFCRGDWRTRNSHE